MILMGAIIEFLLIRYCENFRDQYYITMAKKKKGEFIGTDYNEDYARSFTD